MAIYACPSHSISRDCLWVKIIYLNKLVKKVKCLGVYLTNALTDDDDINRQVRSFYCSANQLKSAFSQCSFEVKNLLFKSYRTNFYGSHLWSKYLKSSFHSIRVAYNDCYRMLHNLPINRYTSARELQVINYIPTFEALLRKNLYNFINRCLNSSNFLVTNMMNLIAFLIVNFLLIIGTCFIIFHTGCFSNVYICFVDNFIWTILLEISFVNFCFIFFFLCVFFSVMDRESDLNK